MRRLPILFILLAAQFSGIAQPQSGSNYFVVIGTFRMLDNAVKYSEEASQAGFMAQYAICPSVGLYYVYVLETSDHLKAHNLSIKMKEETYFKNAWVFNGKLGLENNNMSPADIRAERTKELEAKSMDKPAVKSEAAITSATKPFYFRLISRYDGKEITATLLLKESGERSNYQTVKSGEIIFLREPAGKLKSYNITAFVPGYKLSNIKFFYANPSMETGRNNEEIITLVADKGKNADFVEFNHVQFYPSTSNLRPVSLQELDELGYLLKQHPKCKITIHGHSSLQDQESPDIASSPQKNTLLQSLSLARAETVKAYLVKLGIEPVRINTMGDELPRYAGDKSCYHNSETVDVEFVKENSISTL